MRKRPSSVKGDLLFVLHAHLPFVRHPEYRYALEENWFFEGLTDTYLPLLITLEKLASEQVPFCLTLSISPTLANMLTDPLLTSRYSDYLQRLILLGESEKKRTAHDPVFSTLAAFYHDWFLKIQSYYHQINGDVISRFRLLQNQGYLEIITVAATHGYFPVLKEASAKRAQLAVAISEHQRFFGVPPKGIWLPECGYDENTDTFLSEFGFQFFFLDTHGILQGKPHPSFGVYAPVFTQAGIAALGRDPESSKQVWSSKEGYPGDKNYRDFYRDIGFDLAREEIEPYIHPDGIRIQTGYKYYQVTGEHVELANKAPYNPWVAKEKAKEHAQNFVFNRQHQVNYLSEKMPIPPIIVAPYDAELFGHWWFEGIEFLEHVFRELAKPERSIWLNTPSQYLQEFPQHEKVNPCPSSWGAGGYSAMWVDGSNDWVYRHIHRAETAMHQLAHQFCVVATSLQKRVLNQMARELLLMQASDWTFMMKAGTSVKYAVERVKSHISRFQRLESLLKQNQIDETWLASVENRDNLFPTFDYHIYL